MLERPDLATDPAYATNVARVRNRADVDAAVAAAMARLTADEATAALDRARIANARLNTVVDLLDHPQLVARDRWRPVSTPVGEVRSLRPPLEPVGEAPMPAVPALGAHTGALLAELGYDPAAIDGLRAAGAVG